MILAWIMARQAADSGVVAWQQRKEVKPRMLERRSKKKRFTDWHRIFLGRGAFAGTLNENIFSHNRIMSAGLSFFNGYLR
jgi:hypothetical protein